MTPRILRGFALLGALFAAPSAYSGVYDDMLKAINTHDTAQVVALLQRGIDVDTTDPDGNTLLMLAARTGDTQTLNTLLKNKANLLKINRYGDSALMLAALHGHLECVTALVDARADTDPDGWTPLIYAAFEGQEKIIAYLLAQDVDIDAQSANGMSALMAASRNGRLEAVKLLLEQGADVNLANQDGKTALELALAGKYTEIASLLRNTVRR